jgi:CRISPR-associated Csx2 family protein
MANKLVSFLGTNNYLECIYKLGNKRSPIVKHIQEALVRFLCGGWCSNDEILIFLTDAAKNINWLGQNGLENNLRKACEDMGSEPCVRGIDIPEGKSVEEIWKIFEIVNDQLGEGDRLIFDITHGFRSIPMLGLVLVNYAKVIKSVNLEGIYYGAFEVLGPISEVKKISAENRISPVFDLTEFDRLLDWTIGTEQFISAGSASKISSLIKSDVSRGVFRGKLPGHQQENWKHISKYGRNLEKLTANISTCRLKEIIDTADELQHIGINIASDSALTTINSLVSKSRGEFEPFLKDDPLETGIAVARWCLNHNMIQQGLTMLQESAISWALSYAECDQSQVYDRKYRELVGRASASLKNEVTPSDKECYPKIQKLFRNNEIFRKCYDNLSNIRNDINHAGIREGHASASKLKNILQSSIDTLANVCSKSQVKI